VATSYYNGEGIDENMALAYAWMMAAQKRGDAQAAEALAHIREGLSNQLDLSKFELAQLYRKGDEIPHDLPAAVAFYLESAERKPPLWFTTQAEYELCLLYVDGAGVQDYAQAKSWCKKAGTPFANMVLGRMAEKGLGTDKNPKEALDYYRKAAVRNIAEGYMDAGRLQMESGSHDGQKKAYFWYAIAAKYKFPSSAEKLQDAAGHLNEKEIAEQQKQVNDWLKMPPTKRESEMKKH
jgi:TPR repeat protein